VQAEDGSLGVLSGHAPLVTVIVPGVLGVVLADGTRQSFAVGAGFLEVAGNHARLLVDTAEHPDHIDVDRAKRALERARARLAERPKPDIDYARAEVALRRAIARLKVTAQL
jgi:F-type H+-transporting ATPase subunit epsilon